MQKSIVRAAIGAGLILLIPLVLTLLGKWHWHRPGGYVLAFVLLFSAGLTYELVAKKMNNRAYRFAVGLACGTAFLLTWGSIVQSTDVNPDAVMYFGVPVVGLIGAALARLRPKGMARALFVTALAQVLVLTVALIRLIIRVPQVADWTPPELRGFGGNAFCALLFVGSALLFRRASTANSNSTTTKL